MVSLSIEMYMGFLLNFIFFFLQLFSILEAVSKLAVSLKSLSMILK